MKKTRRSSLWHEAGGASRRAEPVRFILVGLMLSLALCGVGRSQSVEMNGKKLDLLPPSDEVMAMIVNITSYNAMAMNYAVYEVKGLKNAVATIGEGKTKGRIDRVIVYDGKFLEDLANSAGSDWARVAVLAHEIGHHVNGHYFVSDGTMRESQQAELESDRFAGWILGMMGATLSDSLRMWDYLPEPKNVSESSHPPRADRKKTVEEGWHRAQHLKKNNNPTPDMGNSCPIIRLDVPGISATEYKGTFGAGGLTIKLVQGFDGGITGRGELVDPNGSKSTMLVKGNKNFLGGLRLDQYKGCVIAASMDLNAIIAFGYEHINGKATMADGSVQLVSLKSTEPRLTTTGWSNLPTLPKPTPMPSPWSNPTPIPGKLEPAPKPPWYDSPWKDWNPPPLPPAQEAAQPEEISTVGGFAGAWFCVTSKGTPYTLQTYMVNPEFPLKDITEFSKKGYYISQVAGDKAGWAVVMSQGGDPVTEQKILGPSLLQRSEFEAMHGQGWRLTSIAGFQGSWVMVMTKGSKLGEQQLSAMGAWPESWIKSRMTDGYRITAVAGDTNSLLPDSRIVVMSKNSGLGEQVWSDGETFPKDWIRDQWNKGFRITAACGYAKWRIVMSKGSGITYQAYAPVSQEFPQDHIAKAWRNAK